MILKISEREKSKITEKDSDVKEPEIDGKSHQRLHENLPARRKPCLHSYPSKKYSHNIKTATFCRSIIDFLNYLNCKNFKRPYKLNLSTMTSNLLTTTTI